MIPVRIAALLTAEGIEGVRWVLVDADEGEAQLGDLPAPAPESAPGRAATQRRHLRWLLQAAVIAAALVAAAFTTRALLIRFDSADSRPVPAHGAAPVAAPLASAPNPSPSWLTLAPTVRGEWLPGSPAAAVSDIMDSGASTTPPASP